MFCSNCGREIKDTVNFCPYCGKNLKKPAAAGSRNASSDALPAWHPLIAPSYTLVTDYFNRKGIDDESVLDPLYRKMKDYYGMLLPFSSRTQDREYLHAAGLLSLSMADYCLEYHEETDLASGFAGTARWMLKRELDLYQDTNSPEQVQSTLSSLFLATEYAAFCAYMDKKNSEAYTLSSSLPPVTTSLALMASSMFALGEETRNASMVREAFGLMDQVDQSIDQPLDSDYRQLLVTFTYIGYANMLVSAPDKFPREGFERDIRKAVSLLRHIQAFISSQNYKNILQEEIGQYSMYL